MKTLKLFILLTLLSLQAGATGFTHNMFVAHKKLQTGKESHCVKEKKSAVKAIAQKPAVKQVSVVSENSAAIQHFTSQMNGVVTLNERILAEGAAYFKSEEETDTDHSLVAELVQIVKRVVYAFASSLMFGR
jgi:hypothetical protein